MVTGKSSDYSQWQIQRDGRGGGRGSQPLHLFKPVGYLYHMSDTKNCCNGHESKGNDNQLKTFLSCQCLGKYIEKGMENMCTYVKG